MAKYHVLMSCGHEDVLELRGKTAERARQIEYFKSYGICKVCYKKKMREQKEQQDLIFNATVLPYIDPDDGSLLISVWFSGNTMPFKDDIKSLVDTIGINVHQLTIGIRLHLPLNVGIKK